MDPGSGASQGDTLDETDMGEVFLCVVARCVRPSRQRWCMVLPTDRSDVQMCLSMIVSWIAMHTGFHFPLPSRS